MMTSNPTCRSARPASSGSRRRSSGRCSPTRRRADQRRDRRAPRCQALDSRQPGATGDRQARRARATRGRRSTRGARPPTPCLEGGHPPACRRDRSRPRDAGGVGDARAGRGWRAPRGRGDGDEASRAGPSPGGSRGCALCSASRRPRRRWPPGARKGQSNRTWRPIGMTRWQREARLDVRRGVRCSRRESPQAGPVEPGGQCDARSDACDEGHGDGRRRDATALRPGVRGLPGRGAGAAGGGEPGVGPTSGRERRSAGTHRPWAADRRNLIRRARSALARSDDQLLQRCGAACGCGSQGSRSLERLRRADRVSRRSTRQRQAADRVSPRLAQRACGRPRHARLHARTRYELPAATRYGRVTEHTQLLMAQVAAHELGHVLGLAHEPRRCAQMNFAVDVLDLAPIRCPAPASYAWRCRLLEGRRRRWRRQAVRRPCAATRAGDLFAVPGPGGADAADHHGQR